MTTAEILKTSLALDDGAPVRSADDPLPTPRPRIISPEAAGLVRKVLDSGFTLDLISEFETAVAEASGAKYGVAVANCTAAIHSVIGGLGYGPGDEVIVSAISDYGSVAGVVMQGAKPVFADVDARTGLVSAETIEEVISPRTRAIIAVHFYGLMCDMDPIVELARKHDIVVVEDVCQATLAGYKGRIAGGVGDIGCFSFDAGKLLPTDNGGMAISDDADVIAAIRKFAVDRGADPGPLGGREHNGIGFNYRFGDMEAAVGLAQLKILPDQLERRVELAERFTAKIEDIEGVITPQVPEGHVHLHWLYPLQFDLEQFRVDATQMGEALSAEGLKCSTAMYYLIPFSHKFLSDREADLERLVNARTHLERTVRWGFTEKYTERDLDDMAAIVAKVTDAYRR
jgi:dTDP-4-amino-4,6-dideoxygalactose transaminase